MKRTLYIYAALLLVFASCNNKDAIWHVVDDMDDRISRLETICQEMNTNISALETLINAQCSGDYITNITEIRSGNTIVGYTITFKNHEPITIYNGTNGKDGNDGHTPIIGAKQDIDGVYYWTIDGEWLTDTAGSKIRVTGEKGDKGEDGQDGKDGQNGQDGQDGKDGQNGTDGKNGTDGCTPQLKIEDGYWYVSYDGINWEQLGKATGENGADGAEGEKGETGEKGDAGDSMFQSVTQDDNNVYFTLADGTLITVAKGGNESNGQPNSEFLFTVIFDINGGEVGTMPIDTFYYGKSKALSNCGFGKEGYAFVEWNTQPDGSGISYANGVSLTIDKNITLYAQWKAFDGLLPGIFYVSPTRKVQFAPGNLQYQASTNTWRFAEHQYDYLGSRNEAISETNTDWIDLFGFGTSGVGEYEPYSTSTNHSDYPNMTWIYNTDYDWGVNNIQNSCHDGWWTLSGFAIYTDEVSQTCAWKNITQKYVKGLATIMGINGLLLLPENWKLPAGLTFVSNAAQFEENNYTDSEWIILESSGAVFFPAAGYRLGTDYYGENSQIMYWSSQRFYTFGIYYLKEQKSVASIPECIEQLFAHQYGLAVRLVRDVQ